MTSVLRRTSAFTAHEKPTVGDTKTSFVTDDHLGWLRCDGRSVAKADYGILFNVIGYTFGGSGSSFNLPNAQGRVVGHVGSSLIPDASFNYVVGDLSGQDQITITVPQMPSHNHGGVTGADGGHSHNYVTNNDDFSNNQGNYGITPPATTSQIPSMAQYDAGSPVTWTAPIQAVGNHTHTIASQGGNQPISVMQATIFMGNLFIYSGNPPKGTWPYTTGTNIY